AARSTGWCWAWSCWPARASSAGGSSASSAERDRGAPRVPRGAPNIGGVGAMSGPPRSKSPVPPGAGREARGALAALARVDRHLAELELSSQRRLERDALTLVGRAAVAEHAARRERGDLRGQRLCHRARLAPGHDAVGEADSLRFTRIYGATREDQIERAAEADQPRQPHGPAVDQRHAPAPENTPSTASSSSTRRSHQSASSSPP